MEQDIGIDVSLDLSSLCVLDATGAVVCETKVKNEPTALDNFISDLDFPERMRRALVTRYGQPPQTICRATRGCEPKAVQGST